MNNSTNLSNVFHRDQRFLKAIHNVATGVTKPSYLLLERAIVVQIFVSNDQGNHGSLTPPGSIKAKIISESYTISNNANEGAVLLLPLFSFHNISIPEVGEEVFVIRESTDRDSLSFWICRVNDSNFLSKVYAREQNKNQRSEDRYRMGFDVEDIGTEITQTEDRIYSIPWRPGDVIQQGRTDTYIRHSHDPNNNKEGVLELGIKNREKYIAQNAPSIGKTKTKTLHYIDEDKGFIINSTNQSNILQNAVLGNSLNLTLSAFRDSITALAEHIKIINRRLDIIETNIVNINSREVILNQVKNQDGYVTNVALTRPSLTLQASVTASDPLVIENLRDINELQTKQLSINFSRHLSKGNIIN